MSVRDFSVPSPAEIRQTGARMESVDRVPMMVAGDRPFWGFIYTFDPYDNRPYLETLGSMYEQGVRIFSFLLPLPVAWRQTGQCAFELLDTLHDKILQTAPDGLFIPRVFMTTPDWWDAKHRDELIGFRGPIPEVGSFDNEDQQLWQYETKMYHSPRNASIASSRWRTDAGSVLHDYVQHTWRGAYSGHFMGYQVAYGTCGEWGAFGSYLNNRYGCYDFSDPMLAAFRNYLRQKYRSDAVLRKAWQDDSVTLDNAEPPDKMTLLKTDVGVLKDPARCARVVDWMDNYSQQKHQAIIHFCRITKDAAPVPVLAGSFGAVRLQTGCSAYIAPLAQTRINELTDSDAIDFLCSPNSYEDRRRGVCPTVPIQTVCRKKIFISECDFQPCRPGEHGPHSPPSAEKNIPFFKRDTFFNLTQGSGHLWWYDFGLGWYLHRAYEDTVRALVEGMKQVTPADRCGRAEIALVVDELSACYTEGSSGYYKLSRQFINEHLPRCGAPFDIVTTDDMLVAPAYKLYIIRDMWYTGDRRAVEIRRFLDDNRANCLWLYACGLLGQGGLNLDGMRQLTGFSFALEDMATSHQLTILDFEHPMTVGLERTAGTAGNDDIFGVYSPMIYVDDAEAQILGHIESIHKPGIAYKRRTDRFDAWCASPLLPARMIYNLALLAGVHLHVPPGTCMFGSGNLVSLQSETTETIDFRTRGDVSKLVDILTLEEIPLSGSVAKIDIEADEPRLFRQVRM